MIWTIYKGNCSIPYRIFREKVTVPFFARLGRVKKNQAPCSDIQITSGLFYSQVMYQETCGKLLRGREINGSARERPWYFFVIIFLEFPVRTYLRRERSTCVLFRVRVFKGIS